MLTTQEFEAINRTAEKLAVMGVAPAGDEAVRYAIRLLGIVKEIKDDMQERFPKHCDQGGFNALALMRIDAAQPIIEQAQAVVDAIDNGVPTSALPKLVAAVHVYNLVHNFTPHPDGDTTNVD